MLTNAAAVSCRFCAIASGAALDPRVDEPWLEDEQHVAIASVGALVPGWSLVVPKSHGYNLASHYKSAEFHRFVQLAVSRIEERYGPVVVFEHGSVEPDSATSCGTAHAHLHLVPVALDLAAAALKGDSTLPWRSALITEVSDAVGDDEYLFVANRYDGEATAGTLTTLAIGRSQFFRRLIASHLGCPDKFDYKQFPNISVAMGTASALSDRSGKIARVA